MSVKWKVGAAFVRRQLRLADPLVDLRLFRAPGFTASLATYGLSILFSFGGFLFLPQYLQLVLGLSPFRGGLWTIPWSLAFVVGSLLTPVLVRRIRPAFVMAGGLVIAAFGFALFTRIDATTGFALFVGGELLRRSGVGNLVTYVPVVGGVLELVMLYRAWDVVLEAQRTARSLAREPLLWIGMALVAGGAYAGNYGGSDSTQQRPQPQIQTK